MITTAAEYNANLHLINNANPPVFAQLPSAENIYNIDVKTRKIDPPQFLGVEEDHDSETIYFIVDRYADYMDLSETSCIIYYISADERCHIYKVPFYDIYTYEKKGKILIPWCLDRNVGIKNGTVEFAISFFKVAHDIYNDITGSYDPVITYRLNTLPAKSEVLKGIETEEVDKEDEFYNKFAEWQEDFASELDQIKRNFLQLRWTKAEDLMSTPLD